MLLLEELVLLGDSMANGLLKLYAADMAAQLQASGQPCCASHEAAAACNCGATRVSHSMSHREAPSVKGGVRQRACSQPASHANNPNDLCLAQHRSATTRNAIRTSPSQS